MNIIYNKKEVLRVLIVGLSSICGALIVMIDSSLIEALITIPLFVLIYFMTDWFDEANSKKGDRKMSFGNRHLFNFIVSIFIVVPIATFGFNASKIEVILLVGMTILIFNQQEIIKEIDK